MDQLDNVAPTGANGAVALVPAPRQGVRPRQLARELCVAPGVIYRAISDEELPAWRLGRAIVIPADAVDAWLATKGGRKAGASDERAA